MNSHIAQRLTGIHQQLLGVHAAGKPMSSASKGVEREWFINKFLQEVFPRPFRFGSGDATDKYDYRTGQLDVVIEYTFSPSLPVVGSEATRLYLAESVAAVIEVKSNVADQWEEAVNTAKALRKLRQSFGATMFMGPQFKHIPLVAVGFTGWNTVETIQEKIKNNPEVDGVLVIDSALFVAGEQFGGLMASREDALWSLIGCLHLAMQALKVASTTPFDYVLPNAE